MSGEAILGPLPEGMYMQYTEMVGGKWRKSYAWADSDDTEGGFSETDPRLGHLRGMESPSTEDVLALRGVKTTKVRLV